MQIVSPGGNADGSAETIDSDVPVDIIAYNPDGDPQPWALWLVPSGGGDGTGGGPVLVASGSFSAGEPGQPQEVATIGPTTYSEGLFNLVLTAGGSPESVDSDIKPLFLTSASYPVPWFF